MDSKGNFENKIREMIKWLLILLVVLLSYGQTLGMYIWQDDNAVMFKLQHIEEGVGNLGAGIYDRNSAFRFVIVPLIPIYLLSGINPVGYFLAGIFVYFLAALSVYLLAKVLSDNPRVALFAALVFASGLVGAEAVWRIFNSIHTSFTIILICLSLYSYISFIRSKTNFRNFLYAASLIFFILAMEFGYIRAHGIILLPVATELLFNFKIIASPIRLLPFILAFGNWYAFGNINTSHIALLIERIFVNLEFELFLIPLETLKNIFIPNWWNFPLTLFLIALILLLLKFRNKVLIFALTFMISNYLTYFFIYNEAVLETTHRYLLLSSVGLALFIPVLANQMFVKKKVFYAVCASFIIGHLVLVNTVQYQHIKNISLPTREFYQTLRREVPKLEKQSAIYFDIEDSQLIQEKFRNFFGVGSMPDSTAIAIYYNLDRYDIFLPQTFDELLGLIKEGQVKLDNTYTFFYSKNGLINTTSAIQKNLLGPKIEKKVNPENVDSESSTPLLISFNAKVDLPKDLPKNGKKIELAKYLNYLSSKELFYKTVDATASSQWKYQEATNAVDNDTRTSWMAHRGSWHNSRNESITLDLGIIKKVGATLLKFGPVDKTPTYYSYLCSLDGTVWIQWQIEYFRPKNHAEKKLNKLLPRECRFIKLTIMDTLNHDSPTITEVEVIEEEYSDLDLDSADKIVKNPLGFVNSLEDELLIKDYLTKGVYTNICFVTDKNPAGNCQKIKIYPSNNQTYSIISPAGGTRLKNIYLQKLPNIGFDLYNVSVSPLSLNEIN